MILLGYLLIFSFIGVIMDLRKYNLIDLTHSLSNEIPHWENGCGFENKIHSDYTDNKTQVSMRVHHIKMSAGIGTHMDAPKHFFADGKTIEEISLNQLLAPCIVINLSKNIDEKYQLTANDVKEFERNYGKINKNSFVIVYTGWGRYWSTPDKYRNNLVFPTISREAAEILLDRDIAGLGIDTLSPDCKDSGFPVHKLILGAGKYLIENIANAHQLLPTGSFSLALPIKIKDGTEAPIRLIAFQ